MDIIVAEYAGACYGVERAVAKVKEAAAAAAADPQGGRVYTLGPLIHNPQVVSELSAKGIQAIESLDEAPAGSTLVIRSHGVAPSVISEARHRGLKVVDATCPHVSKAHVAARQLSDDGRFVIVVGEEGHPEVEGICAYVDPGRVFVCSKASELPDSLPERLGVVVQTTQSESAFDEVVSALLSRTTDVVVRNTICFATQQRQDAAASLSRKADVMVVIGGRNSGNTRRLMGICLTHCPRSYHIETPDEIDPSWFSDCSVVGVTAGASTPESQVQAVIDTLSALGGHRIVAEDGDATCDPR